VVLTVGAGHEREWVRDCRNNELFFNVDIETEPEIIIGEPQELFRVQSPFARPGKLFSVTPDGQQFLLMQRQDRPVRRRHDRRDDGFASCRRAGRQSVMTAGTPSPGGTLHGP